MAKTKKSQRENRSTKPEQTLSENVRPCPHYCVVGGHIWEHDVATKASNVAICPFRAEPWASNQGIKFFTPCEQHR